jgi:mono/diheme cytochrome c family protein
MTVVVGLCIVAVFEFIVVPSMRMSAHPATADILPQGATGWLDPTEYPAAKGYVVPPVDPRMVMTPTTDLLSRGQDLFEKDCVQCHGAQGMGDGPAAATTNPRPRNFTRAADWKNGYGLAGIFKTLSNGVPNSAMAAFDYVRPKDRMALAHFVQSLARFERKPEDPAALAALAKSFASAATVVPNKIPVSLAMRKLAEEYQIGRASCRERVS